MSNAFKISPVNKMSDWGYMESWSKGTSVAPDGWVMTGTAGSVARETSIFKFGLYSMKITAGATGTYAAEYTYADFELLAGRTIKFGMWVRCGTASKARIYIDDGVSSRANSSYHTGSDEWEFLEVELQVDAANTELVFGCETTNNAIVAYFDGGIFVEGETIFTQLRDTNIYVRETDFSPKISVDVSKFDIPRKDGVLVGDTRIGERNIDIRVQIWEESFAAARAIFDNTVKSITDGEKDLFFADDRYSSVKITNLPKLRYGANARVYLFDLKFLASSPFERYISKLRDEDNFSSSPGTFNLDNNGNYYTLPTFFIIPAGDTMTSITVENLTSGERFSYTADVGAGITLSVDSENLAVEYDGVDGLSDWTGDFIKLVKDTNYFKVTYAGSPGLTILTDRYDRWL